MADVSVISISYNHGEYIDTWFKGLVDQETELDIYYLNDHSTDDSYNKVIGLDWASTKLETYLGKNEENLGGPATFTRAIKLCLEHSKSKYIALLETDDYWKPGKIEKSIKFLEDNNYDAVCTETSAILPDGRYIEKAWSNIGVAPPEHLTFEYLKGRNRVWTSTFIAKREIFEKCPTPLTFSKSFGILGDYPRFLWLTKNNYRLGYLDESLSVYRDGFGVSAEKRAEMVMYDQMVREWAKAGCPELK